MTPHTDRITRARAILANPSACNAHPAVLAAAWADLKAARGQALHLDRLTPAFLRDGPAPVPLDILPPDRMARIAAAVAARLAERQSGGAA
jgi:hypothetical protein